jgi:large-conductance mechanosensitive channel
MFSFFGIRFAEAAVDMTAFGNVVNPIVNNIVYPIIQLMFGLAVVFFVYGALQFVFHGADEKAREKGKATLLYGTIGMFIMVSAWGIVYLISNTVFGLSGN